MPEDALHDEERQITEVLVIDRVELVLLHQLHQVRKLHGDDATRFEQDLHPSNEVIDIGHVREDVVSQIAGRADRKSV